MLTVFQLCAPSICRNALDASIRRRSLSNKRRRSFHEVSTFGRSRARGFAKFLLLLLLLLRECLELESC